MNTSRVELAAPAGVGIMFASNGALFAALLPWYPLLTQRLGLGAAEFGIVVASFAVGAIASSALPTPLIARFGATPVVIAGTVLVGLAVAGAAWATSGWMLAVAIFLIGFFDAIVDVAQNLAGIRVQELAGRSILSSMHALWSLGGVASGAMATLAAANGVDVRLFLAAAAVAGVVLVIVGGRLVGHAADAPDADPTGGARSGGARKVVFLAALPLIAIAIGGTMLEDVANNWAAMSAAQIGGMPVALAGLAFTVTIGSQCIGRFSGDVLIGRFGRAAVARFGGFLIATGALLVVTTHGQVATLLLGLALAGYGSATLVPSAMTAAAALPGVSAGAGVTLVSWLMRIGFLVTSPIIGALTDATNLRWGLCVLVVVGITVSLLAQNLPIAPQTEVRGSGEHDGHPDNSSGAQVIGPSPVR
ncbi:MFS transporter [Clavibacter zhangzhiyongii]|uniref:MFS transporter n=1 Tax=Clavibacter zhangzhiyongii TaxID=2768071 RepID=UPI00195918C8|nr:MFS transporter [Clavibacter zhangzhiyongii]MBM7024976.1 MFS transporter [Clavibacter zhangzhiyongii]